jgi:hypothetical protein
MEASQAAGRRRALRLVCSDGAIVRRMPGEPDGETEQQLSDPEGEDELIDALEGLRERLDDAGDLRYEVTMLLARFEQRRARRV